MAFFFDDGNKSEPEDLLGAALKGAQQGFNLGMFIGKGFLLAGQAAEKAMQARQEREVQRQLEERWRNQQKRR